MYNDVGTLRMVALHRSADEMKTIDADKHDDSIEALIDDHEQWYWRDREPSDIELMQAQHDRLREALHTEGAEVVDVVGSERDVRAVFTRAMAIAINGGAIVCRMGLVGDGLVALAEEVEGFYQGSIRDAINDLGWKGSFEAGYCSSTDPRDPENATQEDITCWLNESAPRIEILLILCGLLGMQPPDRVKIAVLAR